MQTALSKFAGEPQVVSAAIAALFKLNWERATQYLASHGEITPVILSLSALQTTDPSKLHLSDLKINIEVAEPLILRLALLLVGLNKCPEQILHPRFPNKEIVKVLGGHHEPMVSQYSAWATAENPHLTSSDLGIDLGRLDEQPPNVRSYVYRLFASETAYSSIQHDVICQSIEDMSVEARLGSAMGLRETYYDGLDTIVIDWLYSECDADVAGYVLEHVVRHGQKSEGYRRAALEHFDIAQNDLQKRSRMEAAASGTDLYREFRRKSLIEEEGLFRETFGRNGVTNNTFNNYGSIQGQTSMSGTAVNAGDQANSANTTNVKQAHDLLQQVWADIEMLPLDHPLKSEAHLAIEAAKEKPSKERFAAVINALQKIETATKSIAGSAESAMKIGAFIKSLYNLFS